MKIITTILLIVSGIFVNLLAIYPMFTGRNHPEVRWQSFQTANFEIIYSQGLDSLAKKAGSISEQCYDSLQKSLAIKFDKPYKIFITDMDDIANGATTPFDYFAIWVNPSQYKNSFTGKSDWLTQVIAHEMVHSLNFQKAKSWGNWFIPNPGVDHDLLEGFAQFYSGEEWGFSRGDFYLNKAILDDDYSYSSPWPDNGGLLYANGFAKVRNLLNDYPDSLMLNTLAYRNDLQLPDFEEGFQKNYKISYQKFCENNRQKLNIYYNWRKGITENREKIGQIFKPADFAYIHSLKFSPDKQKIYLLATKSLNDPFRQLYQMDLGDSSLTSLVASGIGNNFSISPDGSKIVFNRTHLANNQTALDDLFLYDLKTKSETELTNNKRAFDPVFLDNNTIAYIVNSGNHNDIYSQKFGDLPRNLTSFNENIRLQELSLSQNGRKIVCSFFQDQKHYHGLGLYDLDNRKFVEIYKDTTNLRNPVFLPQNSQKIIFAKNEIKGANLFTLDLENGQTTVLTNFSGSIIPYDFTNDTTLSAIISDSRKIAQIINLSINREAQADFGIIKPEFSNWTVLKPKHIISVDLAKPVSGSFSGNYYSILDLKPMAILPFPYLHEGKEWTGGILSVWSDPLWYHQVGLAAAYNPARPDNPQYSFGYVNRQTAFDLALFSADLETVQLNYAGEIIYQNNKVNTITAGFPYNFGFTAFSNHYLTAGYTWQRKTIINKEDFLPENNDYILNGELLPPEDYSSANIFADYHWKYIEPYSNNGYNPLTAYGFHLNYGYENAKLQSNFHSHSLRSELFYLYPLGKKLGLAERMTLYLFSGFRMIEGKIPAQNQLGLDRYSTISLSGLIPMVVDDSNIYFVRGNRKFFKGNRLLSSTAEIYLPFTNNFGFGFSGLKLAQLGMAAFVDYGSIWQNNLFDRKNIHRATTTGIELRTTVNILNEIVIYGGAAKNLLDQGEKEKFYYGFRTVFPF